MAIQFKFSLLQKLLFPFFVPAFIMLPAVCYMYLKSLTEENFIFTKKDFLHFLPGFIFWFLLEALSLPFFFLKGSIYPELTKNLFKVLTFLSFAGLIYGGIIQFITYMILGIIRYRRHQKKIRNYFSDIENIRLQWMKWFLVGYIIFLSTLILTNLDPSKDKTISDLIYLIVSILFISFTGYYGVKQIDIYASNHSNQSILPPINEYKTESTEHTSVVEKLTETVSDNCLNEEPEQVELKISDAFYANASRQTELKNEITKLLQEDKKYLNVSLTLEDIAKELHTNKKYVSYVINAMMNTNFYTLVNEHRVQEAQKLLSGNEGSQFTIEGVGNMSGFKSRSSFISAFKKYTGKTPSEFKQTILN